MVSHASLELNIPAVLRAWGLQPPTHVAAVLGGTLNWNFDVQTGGGRFFLRCYRSNLEIERIEGEHRLIEWAASQGIPVPVPLETVEGNSLMLFGNDRWAFFPWIEAAPVERGKLSSAQARALGEMHGRVQLVLASHPDSIIASLNMRWDKQQSLNALQHLVTLGKERQIEPWIADGIERQRRLLEATDVHPPEYFASLPCQLLHGDFHDQQALFEGDEVRSIVDWEIWHTDPRAWELVRSLAFSQLLDSPCLADYLAGYRQHIQTSEDEMQLALTLWFQSRVVGLWAWWAYLKDGNERVKEFFPAMLAELDQVTDERWTASIRERVVQAACR